MATMTAPDRLARRAASLTALIVALALSGCAAGGDDGGAPPASGNDTAAPADPATSDDGDDPADDEGDDDGNGGDAPFAGVGDVIFGLVAYGVEEVINCDTALYGDNSVVVDDIIASGRGENGDFMRLFIQRQDISGTVVSYLDYSGQEGVWSSDDGNAIITFTGSSVSGSVVVQNDDGDESDLVQFEFDVPSELTDCS